MPSFASADDRRDDPTTVRLAAELGVNRWEALGRLDCLYWWVAKYAPSGDLAACSDAEIAAACDWTGDAEVLVTALLEAGVLTCDAMVADWHHLFGRYEKQREATARRVAKHRGNGSGNAPGNALRNGARNGVRNGLSNGARNGVGNADAPAPPDPYSPGAPPTGAAPSGPPGDPGDCSPREISGPAPGARARETRLTPAQVRLARVVDLVHDAGVEIFPSSRDGAAVKTCSAPADRIAAAYIAAARGEWDPGGDGWLGDSLSVHLVISRLAGYRSRRTSDYLETRYGSLRAAEPIDDAVAF